MISTILAALSCPPRLSIQRASIWVGKRLARMASDAGQADIDGLAGMLASQAQASCSTSQQPVLRQAGGPAYWRQVACTAARASDHLVVDLTEDSPAKPSGRAALNPMARVDSPPRALRQTQVAMSTKRQQLGHAAPVQPPPAAPAVQHAASSSAAANGAARPADRAAIDLAPPTMRSSSSSSSPSPDRDASNAAKPRRGRTPSSGRPAVVPLLLQPAVVAIPKKVRKSAAVLAEGMTDAAAAAVARIFSSLSLSASGGGGGHHTFSFDLEATGLNVLSARILDIAVVDVETGRWGAILLACLHHRCPSRQTDKHSLLIIVRECRSHSTLVDPEQNISSSSKASQVHGQWAAGLV